MRYTKESELTVGRVYITVPASPDKKDGKVRLFMYNGDLNKEINPSIIQYKDEDTSWYQYPQYHKKTRIVLRPGMEFEDAPDELRMWVKESVSAGKLVPREMVGKEKQETYDIY